MAFTWLKALSIIASLAGNVIKHNAMCEKLSSGIGRPSLICSISADSYAEYFQKLNGFSPVPNSTRSK